MFKKINNFLANKLSDWLSSMWLFWVLGIVLILAAVIQPPEGAYEWAMYIISASFQALALPVLGLVSNIQAEKQNKIISSTNRMVVEELKILKEQQARLAKHLELIEEKSEGQSTTK